MKFDCRADAPLNILVVEDEPDIAELLVYLLGEEGYRVRHASNGMIALTMLAGAQPDLIITDIMMPEMGGLELIEAVHATAENPQIPILVLSALPRAHVEGRSLLVSAFMQKPFRGRDLIANVATLLARNAKPAGTAR